MALEKAVMKNIVNDIICKASEELNINLDADIVTYFVDLLILNAKYRKLFMKPLNKHKYEHFVLTCFSILIKGEIFMVTLKIQYIIKTEYDSLANLVTKHMESIEDCLRPLVREILATYPDDEEQTRKLFRKISIYIILASGLGNPGDIMVKALTHLQAIARNRTLKEGVAALESVFSLDDLKSFIDLTCSEKRTQLNELIEIVSGVRLFNRDCKRGGEGIPDLPFNLVDAAKACNTRISECLITIMERVNILSTAIEDFIKIEEDTGNVILDISSNNVTKEDYINIFHLLSNARQYEVVMRKLLADTETIVGNAHHFVEKVKVVLGEVHAAVKFKSAVPVVLVFPLFIKLWNVWRAMQNEMYLVSTVNKLISVLEELQENVNLPQDIVSRMLEGKSVKSDQQRLTTLIMTVHDRMSLITLKYYESFTNFCNVKNKKVMFLGFCTLCLCTGALVPSNPRLGLLKVNGEYYGFCSVKMAEAFNNDPQRYINEVLDYARNNPHVIHLLDIYDEVYRVRHDENLVVKYVAKTKVQNQGVQTETHPKDSYIEKNYSWNLWEHKRRACQWATIANCRTHSTQTVYSHMRSEIQCQTVEQRDKCMQTKKDCGTNVSTLNTFLWGLRGQLGDGQHVMDLTEPIDQKDRLTAQTFERCWWPCPGECAKSDLEPPLNMNEDETDEDCNRPPAAAAVTFE